MWLYEHIVMHLSEWYHKNSQKLSDNWVNAWQIPIVIVGEFYECECICDIYVYMLLYIVWVGKDRARAGVGGRLSTLYVIYVNIWKHVRGRGRARVGSGGRWSIVCVRVRIQVGGRGHGKVGGGRRKDGVYFVY